MILPVAEYCAPVWMDSCHVSKIDTQINCALRIVTGTVQSTEVEWLYMLSNIAPPHIRRQEAALRECKKIEADPELPLHIDVETAPANLRLRSRNPFWRFYQERDNLHDYQARCREWWENASVANKQLIEDPMAEIKGLELPRKVWLKMNRFRTGQGCCAFLLHRWRFPDSPLCECGDLQTMEHILNHCVVHRFHGNLSDIHNATDEAIAWIDRLNINV